LDGATLSVAVPEDAPVAELKRAISVLREVPCFTIELGGGTGRRCAAALAGQGSALLAAELLKQASDRLALGSLFKSCGGAGWEKKGGRMVEADLGEWEGVTVDAEGRVIGLELVSSGLVGSILSDIQQLSALQYLNLSNNSDEPHKNELTGPIPRSWGGWWVLAHSI
jgi:hypothetical protein